MSNINAHGPLQLPKTLEHLALSCTCVDNMTCLSDLNALKSLKLCGKNMSNDMLAYIVKNFRTLQSLEIVGEF